MTLARLSLGLAEALDGDLEIEKTARAALMSSDLPDLARDTAPLPNAMLDVLQDPDAHPVCRDIAATPLPWAPPQTSDDPTYIAHSIHKLHVELIGPDGFLPSEQFRIGLYGFLPGVEYGIRTHAAEEVFVMLAGVGHWKSGDGAFNALGPGARAHHPSFTPHGTKSTDQAFMSIYVWRGDVSTDSYHYTAKTEL